jgi:hypothetical protein
LFVDDYLVRLDRFAQGDNALRHGIGAEAPMFYAQLADLLHAGDQRAVSRLVFSVVVKIVFPIPAASRLGREALRIVPSLAVTKEDDKDAICPEEFYVWWKAKKGDYPSFPLLDQWEMREFSREKVIPMFQHLYDAKRRKG